MKTVNQAGVEMELPRYRCHKEVWALKIASFDRGRLVFEDDRYAPIKVGDDWIDRHDPQVGGYYVVYKDGYTSYSPAAPFEAGYSLIR